MQHGQPALGAEGLHVLHGAGARQVHEPHQVRKEGQVYGGRLHHVLRLRDEHLEGGVVEGAQAREAGRVQLALHAHQQEQAVADGRRGGDGEACQDVQRQQQLLARLLVAPRPLPPVGVVQYVLCV